MCCEVVVVSHRLSVLKYDQSLHLIFSFKLKKKTVFVYILVYVAI